MSIWISWVILAILTNLILAIEFEKLNNINKTLKLIDYLCIIIFSVIISVAIINVDTSLRFITNVVLVLILYKIIFKLSITKTAITTCLIYIIVLTSEMIYTILFITLKIDLLFFTNNIFGIIIINILILLLTYIIINNKFVNNTFANIINWYKDNKIVEAILLCVISELTIFFLIYQNYSIEKTKAYFFINNIFFIGIVLFIIGFFKQKTDNSKLLHDYDHLLEYSKEYEKEVVEKSKKQHEYKNQLAIIENMIYPQNKKAINYIRDLLNEEKDDKDSKVLEKLTYIKSIGLKGFIHFKIKEMDNKKIESFIDVSEQLNKNKLWKICYENLQDISRCIGVYLDNAIEASSISDKKQISLLTYLENDNIVFLISNTYKGELDISKFGNEGYSSKGKNRGFGLSLVKEIIGNNESLSQYKEINGEYYTQKLYIKTK